MKFSLTKLYHLTITNDEVNNSIQIFVGGDNLFFWCKMVATHFTFHTSHFTFAINKWYKLHFLVVKKKYMTARI